VLRRTVGVPPGFGLLLLLLPPLLLLLLLLLLLTTLVEFGAALCCRCPTWLRPAAAAASEQHI
jgi:hypothetical protein